MKLIVKFFPEITIKSKPVRKQQARHLRDNISKIVKEIEKEAKVIGLWDCVEVLVPEEVLDDSKRQTIFDAMQRIPGIANFIVVREYPLGDFEDAFQKTKDAYGELIRNKRFVVRVKRAGTHDFTSTQMEQYIGGGLRQHVEGAEVSLRHPDVTVKLEVRHDKLYVITERFEGIGGYPIGAIDPVLSLMSGGFDSGVASYLTIRRGMKTHFCFFSLGGTTHEVGVKQVAAYLWERYESSHRVKFVTVPFEGVVEEILKSVHHSQMGVVLKRMMLRAAATVAKEMKIPGLVTGESVSQVSSQTLPNLAVIDAVTEAVVLRPLITMDKQDIIQLAAKIGTEEFAKNMPEYCGVISDRPTTRARLNRIVEEEGKFDFDVLESAIAEKRIANVDEIMSSKNVVGEVEIVTTPQMGDIVVDIRHPNEIEKQMIELTNNDILQIPFYELISAEEKLDKAKSYLLYCEKGTMSQLHASNLKANGFSHVKVYQP